MKSAWNLAGQRIVERVEIIDLKSEHTLYETWRPLISHYHYDCRSCFFDSYIAHYPRRSGEALFAPSIHGRPAEQFPIPIEPSFDDPHAWLAPIAQFETEGSAYD
jgi:hypothetical protein